MAIVVAPDVALDGNARVSREKKLTLPLKSPYKSRIVDVKTKLTAKETAVSEWLFNFRGEFWDVVVSIKYGVSTLRGTMESLFPRTYIFFQMYLTHGVIY